MVRREKPVRALASPEIHKSSKTTVSEADESLSSKNDYLKSLFVKQKVISFDLVQSSHFFQR